MSDVDRLIVAINDLDETVSHLTAAVEYAVDRYSPPEDQDDPQASEDDDAAATASQGAQHDPHALGRVAAWLTSEGFDIDHLNLTNLEGEVKIETEVEFDRDEAWLSFTQEHFVNGGPGRVEWREVEDSDKSYPVFYIDHDRIEEVAG